MTERKPAGLSFESWIDGQIREAEARGEFDEKIVANLRVPPPGPPLGYRPIDIEAAVATWRRARERRDEQPPVAPSGGRRKRWWRRG